MQLYPILLVAVVLAADAGVNGGSALAVSDRTAALVAVMPPLLLVLAAAVGVAACRRRLDRDHRVAAVAAADRIVRWARWAMLANHAAAVLLFGWLHAVRRAVGDLILLDEAVAILPPVIGAIGTWWVYYPIERRVRQAILVRQLDQGRTVFPLPSCGRYVLTQARINLLFVLAPILAIVTLAEIIERTAAGSAPWVVEASTFVAAIAVVAVAPLLARLVLDLEPLREGPLRDDLSAICAAHRVRVGGLMVWRTYGTVMNAAVMGLFGPLRYVLLSDGLLESMSPPQVRAVMAHEIGHVRRRHMPWMMAVLITLLLVPAAFLEAAWRAAAMLRGGPPWQLPDWAVNVTSTGSLLFAFVAFGWVSRRFERQADTFAARHLSENGAAAAAEPPPSGLITAEAVGAVAGALASIARLDAARPRRPSWRHGSIQWRCDYLATLVGRRADRLDIDRQVGWIKGVTAALLVAAVGYLVNASGALH